MILPEDAGRLRLTLSSIPGIMHLTSSISNLKKYSMCCGLYFHSLLKWLLALSLAYFCSAGARWPPLVPKAGAINQGGGVTVKTQQESRFHSSELHRGLHMGWYENLIVMVMVRDHSSESSSSAWVRNCGQGQRGAQFYSNTEKGIP